MREFHKVLLLHPLSSIAMCQTILSHLPIHSHGTMEYRAATVILTDYASDVAEWARNKSMSILLAKSHWTLFTSDTQQFHSTLASYSRVTLSQLRDSTRFSMSFLILISLSLFILVWSASNGPLGSAFWRLLLVFGRGKTRKLFLDKGGQRSYTVLSFALSCFM